MKPTFLLLAVLIGFVGIQASLAQAVVQFTTTSYTVAENAGAVTLSVQRTGDTSMRTSVDYLSADGTATHGVKYTAVTGGAISQVGGLEDGVRDFVVVLDELTKWNETDARFAGRLRLDQIGAIGFSWGSPTIDRLAQQEPRCKAVVLLEGDRQHETRPRHRITQPPPQRRRLHAHVHPAPASAPSPRRQRFGEGLQPRFVLAGQFAKRAPKHH